MNQLKLRTNECIAKGKWSVVYVGGSEQSAPFAYTIGLTHYGLSELLITGPLRPEDATGVLNMFGDLLRSRKDKDITTQGFTSGELVSLGGQYPLRVLNLTHAGKQLMLGANSYYEGVFEAQQVIYPDHQGRFPDDPNSEFYSIQPLYVQ